MIFVRLFNEFLYKFITIHTYFFVLFSWEGQFFNTIIIIIISTWCDLVCELSAWANAIRALYTFETPVKLHTQTLTNTIFFCLKWYEKLAMSVCKKMIENVPDDLNVYSISFYFILVVVMVNMIKKVSTR